MTKKLFKVKYSRLFSSSIYNKRLFEITDYIILFFIFLNSLKVALFNIFIMSSPSILISLYKFGFTFLLTLVIFMFIFKNSKPYLFILFYLVQAIYISVNLIYYTYNHNYLHILQVIKLFSEGIDLIKNFSIPFNPNTFLALIDIPAFLLILIFYSKISFSIFNKKNIKRIIILVSFCLLLLMEGRNYLRLTSYIQLVNKPASGETFIIQRYGTLANSLSDLFTFNNRNTEPSDFQYGESTSSITENKVKPNFILIQVESLNAEIVNHKFNDTYVTPFLNTLSNESVYFPFTLSYHEAGGTSDIEFTVINSVEPLEDYPSVDLPDYDFPNSMIKRFSNELYTTAAFHGNNGDFFNRDVVFKKEGFNKYYDLTAMNLKQQGWGASDEEVFNFVQSTFMGQTAPFLNYIITMSSHEPFKNTNHYYDNNAFDDIPDKTVKNYFKSMAYVDKCLKDFITNTNSNLSNTYILIYGDHTPGIFNDDYHQSSITLDNKYFEFVPLFILTPDKKVYKETNKVASFLDIAPTILKSSGITFDIKTKGENLLEPNTIQQAIPFEGGEYEREYLFKEISEQK